MTRHLRRRHRWCTTPAVSNIFNSFSTHMWHGAATGRTTHRRCCVVTAFYSSSCALVFMNTSIILLNWVRVKETHVRHFYFLRRLPTGAKNIYFMYFIFVYVFCPSPQWIIIAIRWRNKLNERQRARVYLYVCVCVVWHLNHVRISDIININIIYMYSEENCISFCVRPSSLSSIAGCLSNQVPG